MSSSAVNQLEIENRPGRARRIAVRVLVALVIIVFLLAGATYLWFRSAIRAALPQIDGTVAVSGLSQPVNVIRDQHGVPHITAATMDDLFFAQGYVTAQDRLWHMDITRRYASGELSAVLGSGMVEVDKAQRVLGLRQIAQREAAALPERDRRYLEAYARGVNAYISSHQYGLPLEFRVLRYFPNAWTPEDSILIGASMAELLTHGSWLTEIKREAVTARVGPEIAADLYVNTSGRDLPPQQASNPGEIPPPPPNDGVGEEESALPPHSREWLNALVHADGKEEALAPGSNNWVVSGAHTVTGKPLLANDMHLPLQIPGTWYEAHLTSGDFDVAGVTLPGMPAVIVGHNRRIAWGFTNVMPDVEDVYIENFNERGEYQTPQGWRAPEVRHETIRVKRGKDVPFDIVVTRHGPIISELVKGEHRKLALRWTTFEPGTLTFPFFDVDAASNWQEFRTNILRLKVPGQNAVYADVDGHIGYQMTGMYPIRAAGNGSLPVSGTDDAHEWTGWLAMDQLPNVFDPETGIIATANSRVTPDGYPHVVSNEWVSPYRVERIYRTLRQDKKFTAADMLALQTDTYSALDMFAAQRFTYALDHSSKTSERGRHAADLLRNFDGRMEKDSAGAAIERTSRLKLREILLKSKLGDDAKLYSWFMQGVWLENVLLFQPKRWLPPSYDNWNDLLADAVQKALDEQKAPSNLASWKYGEIFPVDVHHPVFSMLPILSRMAASGRLPQSGDGETVKQVGIAFGPSERFTADLADLDRSTLNIVAGQSGNLTSPYYLDQWSAWYGGTTYNLPFAPESIAKAKSHELKLLPQ